MRTHEARGVVVLDGLRISKGLEDGIGLQDLAFEVAKLLPDGRVKVLGGGRELVEGGRRGEGIGGDGREKLDDLLRVLRLPCSRLSTIDQFLVSSLPREEETGTYVTRTDCDCSR